MRDNMELQDDFHNKVKELKSKMLALDEDASQDSIEATATRLEGLNYSPPVSLPLPLFLRLTKETLINEVDKILDMPDKEACALAPDSPDKCQDLRIQFISVLFFYFKQIIRLRCGDAEAWDEVDELYVHD